MGDVLSAARGAATTLANHAHNCTERRLSTKQATELESVILVALEQLRGKVREQAAALADRNLTDPTHADVDWWAAANERLKAEVAQLRGERDAMKAEWHAEAVRAARYLRDERERTTAAVRAGGNAADALRALVTICRDCREKPADWLMWGKLFPEHQLGFKCDDCAHKAGLGWTLRRHDQSALIDCRPAREALEVLEPDGEKEAE